MLDKVTVQKIDENAASVNAVINVCRQLLFVIGRS